MLSSSELLGFGQYELDVILEGEASSFNRTWTGPQRSMMECCKHCRVRESLHGALGARLHTESFPSKVG